jgi:hypothetical protein
MIFSAYTIVPGVSQISTNRSRFLNWLLRHRQFQNIARVGGVGTYRWNFSNSINSLSYLCVLERMLLYFPLGEFCLYVQKYKKEYEYFYQNCFEYKKLSVSLHPQLRGYGEIADMPDLIWCRKAWFESYYSEQSPNESLAFYVFNGISYIYKKSFSC